MMRAAARWREETQKAANVMETASATILHPGAEMHQTLHAQTTVQLPSMYLQV